MDRIIEAGSLNLLASMQVQKMPTRREHTQCPYCQRTMSFREEDEQGSCNDCYEFYRGVTVEPDRGDW